MIVVLQLRDPETGRFAPMDSWRYWPDENLLGISEIEAATILQRELPHPVILPYHRKDMPMPIA